MSTAALPSISAQYLCICQIWSDGSICLVSWRWPHVKPFSYMFMHAGSFRRGDVNDVMIYDNESALEGRYGCTRGPISVHVRADMGSR